MDQPRPAPVSLADAELAAGIARAAASGRAADRRPTPQQLLAAFGEPEATPEARRRVADALAVAGVRVEPDLLAAPAGERVTLDPSGAGAPTALQRAKPALLGGGALAAVLIAGAVAASLMGGDDGSAGDALAPDTAPAVTTVTVTPTAPAPGATAPATTAGTTAPATTPATTPAETAPTDTSTTPTTTTDAEAEAEADAAEERARERRRATERRRARARARREAAARRRRAVTVRVDTTGRRPTFLCVEDQNGRRLFSGTLNGRRIFKGREIRLNVGLASTIIKVDRRTISLDSSPDGVAISRTGVRDLPLGQRPC